MVPSLTQSILNIINHSYFYLIWIIAIYYFLAGGTKFSCADKANNEIACSGDGTDAAPKICYCEKADCNSGSTTIECLVGGGIGKTNAKKAMECQPGIVNCKNVTTSKYTSN